MLTFRLANTKYDHGWCVLIRTLAFEVELNVDIALEIDEYEDDCRHILCLDNNRPCATARWRRYRPGIVKIERVAVLRSWRGRNVGSALMKHVMSDALDAVPFYEKLGFRVVGEPFLEANIIHYTMEKAAPDPRS